MNIHYFKHVPYEGLGCLDHWVKNPEHNTTATKFYEDYKLPFVEICELLIVMGGPMSVGDTSLYPWMTEEKKFVEKALHKGKKVLGICLGSQIIADVLGARVYKNTEKEIGWYDLHFYPDAIKHPLLNGIPESIKTFHWHGDTFDLPDQALLLGSSEATTHQGFLWNNQALALQFHMEMTNDTLPYMIDNNRYELVADKPYIQKESELIIPELLTQNNEHIFKMVNNFVALN